MEPVKKFKPFEKRYSTLESNSKKNTFPRNWSSKFWTDFPIEYMLSEVMTSDDVSLHSIEMHDTLNPDIWENDKLKEDVRKGLLKNVVFFIEHIGIPDLKLHDVVLTGSLANYNYTENSDLDLHIIIDFKTVGSDIDIVRSLFKEKKDTWNDNKDIKIKGYDVESYMQDINEPSAMGGGIYSIYKNIWIEKPMKKVINVDKEQIQVKASDIMNAIDSIELIHDPNKGLEKVKKILSRIMKMRKNGLSKEGEFSIENLVFKVLRHSGYIEKLKNLKTQYIETSLSVKENKFKIE